MITKEELLDNGFKYIGLWNNREYYSKNGFEIVEHNGIYRCDDDHLSGYDDEIETMENLNNEYIEFSRKIIEGCKKIIEIHTNELNRLKTLVNQ